MKTRVIIRADGGSPMGMGHVVRTLTMADMLKHDFAIAFAIQQSDEAVLKIIKTVTQEIILLPKTTDYILDANHFAQHLKKHDIVVLDGYNFETAYQQVVKDAGCKLISIDDLHSWHHLSDAVINYAHGVDIAKYSAEPYTRFYLGLGYVLLRAEFLNSKNPHKEITSVKKVFISMGAADAGNLSRKFTEALVQLDGIEEINLMLGSINPHLKSMEELAESSKQVTIKTHFDISATGLKQLLSKCDVAICPASSISLECCATGIGLITGYTANNQLGIFNGLLNQRVAVDLGDFNSLSVEEVKNKLQKIIAQPQVLSELIKNQAQMIDGKSSQRVLNIFKQLEEERLRLRFATQADLDLYFNWANDKAVRANSYNQNQVEYETHVKWFTSKLNSADCSLYLFMNNNSEPVGQVRIDKAIGETVIGISIDEKHRGKKYGAEMLNKATENYLQQNFGATITAYVKVENAVSYSIFKSAGFTNDTIVNVQGEKSYRLEKQATDGRN